MPFVVRQPIFNLKEEVEGYELRIEKPEDRDLDPEEIVATALVALERIPAQWRTTVDCLPALLRSPAVARLPRDRVVLAMVPRDASVTELQVHASALRKAGFTLGLRDFEVHRGLEPLLPLLDTVGIRMGEGLPALRQHVLRTTRAPLRLVARWVSTRTEWSFAERAGFRYFHGAYFLSPGRETKREVSPSRLACLQLLRELREPELNLNKLEDLMKAEPSFCYRLLRYLNSAAFFGMAKVTSIRHAMALLGEEELRRWLSLMATVASADGTPGELIATAMLRARFCEVLWPSAPDHGFMVGLFSLMPLIVNMQLGALLSVIKLPAEVDRALWGEPCSLRTLLDLAVAFERAQWQVLYDLAGDLKLSQEQVFAARGEASNWTNEILYARAVTV